MLDEEKMKVDHSAMILDGDGQYDKEMPYLMLKEEGLRIQRARSVREH